MGSVWKILAITVLTGCTLATPTDQPGAPGTGPATSAGHSPVNFASVARQIEPLAEQMCRQRTTNTNCDFKILVDDRAGQPPNAYQTLDPQGSPVIGFTAALIARAHNNDELDFVMGHEAAHHILGHLGKTRDTALVGAVLGGLLATLAGGNTTDVDLAQNIGGSFGARTYSKDFELEAQSLHTGPDLILWTGRCFLPASRIPAIVFWAAIRQTVPAWQRCTRPWPGFDAAGL